MTTWKKLDVQGDLNPIVAKARGKADHIFYIHGEDLFITSQREGRHGTVSLHPDGWAFDIRKPVGDWDAVASLRKELGNDFDVINEADHIHIEYDPK